jgi:NTP pyrophosphatase (non-canonical NTP hydrolase)
MNTLLEYQRLAARTSGANGKTFSPSAFAPVPPVDDDVVIRVETCSLGLIGELGELADHIKKHVGHRHELDREVCLKELGDIYWYVAEAHSMFGVNMPADDLDDLQDAVSGFIKAHDADLESRTTNMQQTCSLLREGSYLVAEVGLFIEAVLANSGFDREINDYWTVLSDLSDVVHRLTVRLGFEIRKVLEANIEKLKKRYPDGFSSEASVNRKE